MRKVLIVSPRFPPKNAADIHRVRMSLPWYRRFRWAPTVLCVDPATADSVDDPLLAQTLPPDVPVTRVRAWSEETCRRFGFGELSYRSVVALYRAGCRMLAREKYDVVFFSTTVFLTFALGPLWKRRFGCKVVYDFQDPWYDERTIYTRETVPGSWWKYRVGQRLARHLEKFALESADHVISVSPGYVSDLMRRYPWLDRAKFTILPFPGSRHDYDFIHRHAIKQRIFDPADRSLHWVYAGRAGPDMDPVLRTLFQCLAHARARDPELGARLRVRFVGTNYASAQRTFKLVEPLAREHGVADLVEELSERIPYFETLSLYEASDAVLLIGSTFSDYTASKLLSCVLSKRPILALLHRQSLASDLAARFANVFLATFDASPAEPDFQAQVLKGIAWLRSPSFDATAIDAQIKPWSAEESTRHQCEIFDTVCSVAPLDAVCAGETPATP
jgi:Glycosyl transferase 4-like domain